MDLDRATFFGLIPFAAKQESSGGRLPCNVRFVFEGEEENGSQGFRAAVRQYLHWLEGTNAIVISNTTWIGEVRG